MQRVLITAASRGIGQACAQAFARHGAHVALNHPGLPGRREELEQRIPLGRIGQARDIADLAYALTQDGFEFVTGAEVIADGGVMASAL